MHAFAAPPGGCVCTASVMQVPDWVSSVSSYPLIVCLMLCPCNHGVQPFLHHNVISSGNARLAREAAEWTDSTSACCQKLPVGSFGFEAVTYWLLVPTATSSCPPTACPRPQADPAQALRHTESGNC